MALFSRRDRADNGDGSGPRIPDPPSTAQAWAEFMNGSYTGPGGPPLDLSLGSLPVLDAAIDNLKQAGRELPEGWERGAACYLGECLRRAHGGEYLLGPDPVRDPLVLQYDGGEFTVSALFFHRIRERYDDGPDADISFYAAGYGSYIERKQSADLI